MQNRPNIVALGTGGSPGTSSGINRLNYLRRYSQFVLAPYGLWLQQFYQSSIHASQFRKHVAPIQAEVLHFDVTAAWPNGQGACLRSAWDEQETPGSSPGAVGMF
ncbi:hypothetical protein PCANC_05195 [Puccinia coronata f. sp. avenae]|uniref:Uncharacterized protein n=1 Tax=Puccinia coronata f. sp. avenae TaxID=200324 RepID=A0A2N5VN51_9BASI|nr:hypothetical protein PCASD_05251 [Puccinia coronata f. sp. avenae]PLW51422.1 hypothetical protein PCASD_00387 [Puccinia coronata f. sp. avenae]PLW54309.1 hypothetical protein PCANC_05195 [Puccinia coronata f. sp. avenae]